MTYSSVVVDELVHYPEEEKDADDDWVALALVVGVDVSSTKGLSSLSNVTEGRSENCADGGQSKTPGPELKPYSSIPELPQKEQPNKIGITV